MNRQSGLVGGKERGVARQGSKITKDCESDGCIAIVWLRLSIHVHARYLRSKAHLSTPFTSYHVRPSSRAPVLQIAGVGNQSGVGGWWLVGLRPFTSWLELCRSSCQLWVVLHNASKNSKNNMQTRRYRNCLQHRNSFTCAYPRQGCPLLC